MEVTGLASKFLRGTFTGVKVEPGGRIVVPRRWREIQPVTQWIGCPWPLIEPRSIGVFPEASWEARYRNILMKRMDAANAGEDETVEQLGNLMALMNGSAEDLKLDKLGRLCLGANLTSVIGLKQEAVLRAGGDYFEVLTPEVHEADWQERQQRARVDQATLRRYLLSN